MSPGELLWQVLREPLQLPALPVREQELALRLLRNAHLLAQVAVKLADAQVLEGLPWRLRDQLQASLVLAAHQHRLLGWDLNRLERVAVGLPVVLLKGAAYDLLGLALARGRLMSDVDLLVAEEQLGPMEQLLNQAGWLPVKLDAYDQRYYRQWMHELPPLRHRERLTWLDLHHALLPRTSRLAFDVTPVLQAARPLPGRGFLTLAPVDQTLHAIVHLCCDSDFHNVARGVVDVDGLMRHHARHEPDFWPALERRAKQLGLEQPLAYAYRLSGELLHTPMPAGAKPARGWVVEQMLKALRPDHPDHPGRGRQWTQWLLYIRSHWLRMPPRLLLQHLARKGFRRVQQEARPRWL